VELKGCGLCNKTWVKRDLTPPKKMEPAIELQDENLKNWDSQDRTCLLQYFETVKSICPDSREYFTFKHNQKLYYLKADYIEERKAIEDTSYQKKLFGTTAKGFIPFQTLTRIVWSLYSPDDQERISGVIYEPYLIERYITTLQKTLDDDQRNFNIASLLGITTTFIGRRLVFNKHAFIEDLGVKSESDEVIKYNLVTRARNQTIEENFIERKIFI
jgi:hypothetical protein